MIYHTKQLLFLLVFSLLSGVFGASAHAETYAEMAFDAARKDQWSEAQRYAKLTRNNAFKQVITWKHLNDGDVTASFDEYADFLEKHDDWPGNDNARRKAYGAFLLEGAKKSDAERLKKVIGKDIRHMDRSELIRHAWAEAFLHKSEEEQVLDRLGSDIDKASHAARADRLIWGSWYTAASRRTPNMSREDAAKTNLRIALLRRTKNADSEWNRASSSIKKDVNVQYARAYYLKRNGRWDALISLLKSAPDEVPHPGHWWNLRKRVVRDSIEEGNYKTAKALLANHGQVNDGSYDLAEAYWFKGWLALNFMNEPRTAIDAFKHFYDVVDTPLSKGRGAYWAGLAAKKLGDAGVAKQWFAEAAKYPMHFYGQMALYELEAKPTLQFPPEPRITSADKADFKNSSLIQAAQYLVKKDLFVQSARLIQAYIRNATTEGQRALAVDLAADADEMYAKVRMAKEAQRGNTYVMSASFPTIRLKFDNPIEDALTHAITRQESEFRSTARSGANAFGMMQLLRPTAQKTARANGIPYSSSRLLDPQYNMRLGSLYLDKLIDSYEGNYILAIVSYNAGPSRAKQWVARFGMPGQSVEQTLHWLELVPFEETRNYVQRVLENLQVYRQRLSSKDVPLKLHEDLLRGNARRNDIDIDGLY